MMKKSLLVLISILAMALMSVGCGDPAEYTEEEPANNSSSNNSSSNNNVDPMLDPTSLELLYISGHFGSYYDCPEEAYQHDGEDASAERPEPVGAGAIAGDCAEDSEGGCGSIHNCESAQVTIRITNQGDDALSGIEVIEILVLDGDSMERASLPILGAMSTSGEAFDGTLEAGASVDLRVDFRGPRSLSEILGDDAGDEDSRFSSGSGAAVRVFVKGAGQNPAVLDTPEIQEQPAIAT